ncbi:MAG: translation initiation factor IF-1A [Nanoarchaeota archaeon]|nr:translation initiation factor IF-1A [Nanoarchaeota archaeon]
MDKKDYGDFEEVVNENDIIIPNEEGGEFPVRVKLPRGKELIGIIVQRYGGNRMDIKATDGKNRNCRVPGRFKRSFWLRPGDYVMILPWEDDNDKGDIIYKYTPAGVNQLKKKGFVKGLNEGF